MAVLKNTPFRSLYSLREKLGLSPGAVVPALNQLIGRGLVERGDESARGKKPFAVTASGRLALVRDYQYALGQAEEQDLDSILRATMALALERSPFLVGFLESAAQRRREKARRLDGVAQGEGSANLPAEDLYTWAKAFATSRQLNAEAAAIEEIAARLQQPPGGERA